MGTFSRERAPRLSEEQQVRDALLGRKRHHRAFAAAADKGMRPLFEWKMHWMDATAAAQPALALDSPKETGRCCHTASLPAGQSCP